MEAIVGVVPLGGGVEEPPPPKRPPRTLPITPPIPPDEPVLDEPPPRSEPRIPPRPPPVLEVELGGRIAPAIEPITLPGGKNWAIRLPANALRKPPIPPEKPCDTIVWIPA